MDINRKRVALCGDDQTLNGALGVALSDHIIMPVTDPLTIDNGEVDVLVWQFGGELATEELARVAAGTPTLVVADSAHILEAVDAGCRGFLPGTAGLHEIRDGVLVVADGGAVVPPELLGTLLRHVVDRSRRQRDNGEVLSTLTARERDVFRLASQGARKEGIAASLFISPATARTHLQRVYRKLDVHSQVELIALAVRIGEFENEEMTNE